MVSQPNESLLMIQSKNKNKLNQKSLIQTLWIREHLYCVALELKQNHNALIHRVGRFALDGKMVRFDFTRFAFPICNFQEEVSLHRFNLQQQNFGNFEASLKLRERESLNHQERVKASQTITRTACSRKKENKTLGFVFEFLETFF